MQNHKEENLGVESGVEFRAACDYWEEHRTARRQLHLIPGDRDIHVTFTRAWESVGRWHKTMLILFLLTASLQKPNPEKLREDMDKVFSGDPDGRLKEFNPKATSHVPSLERELVEEHDAYMARTLYQTCQILVSGRNSFRMAARLSHTLRQLLGLQNKYIPQTQTIVAVVGAAHVAGIHRFLTEGRNPRIS